VPWPRTGKAAIHTMSRSAPGHSNVVLRLSESAGFFKSLVDLANDLIFTADPDGRLTYVNATAARVLQYSAAELIGRRAIDLVPKDYRKATAGFYRRQTTRRLTDTYYEFPVVTRTGVSVWLGQHVRLVLENGRIDRLHGVARDITDRKRAEEALRQSEARHRQAFDENPAGISVISPSGQVRTCNPAFVRIYGFSSMADALGANLGALYPDRVFAGLIELVRRHGAVQQHETTLRRVDGKPLHVIETLIGRFDERGELISVNGYVFDDTPRKELQLQVRQAQKMDAIGRLAGGIAHDFNNILMVINGLSETVLQTLEDGHPLREDVVEILAAGRRATTLTSQLLAFSRKRVLQPTTFDLDEAIGAMQPMLSRLLGPDIELVVTASPGPKWIVADRGQSEQVLLNLAANSRDAMPHGGRVILETDVAQPEMELGGEPLPPQVRLRITDTGVGMSPEIQARVFEPYFTTKERGKGTGLGLSTVYGIVSESGGMIGVQSEVGHGTTFTIRFPLAPAPDSQPAEAAARAPESIRFAQTILVVEDEMPVRQVVVNALRRFGYDVLAADNAAIAMRLLREHGTIVRLLITDIVMPGLNGRELARAAQALHPGLPVLYMSGYADRTFGPEGPPVAAGDFLQKPFKLEHLIDKVRMLID
jgi:two-component system, cell cycle sensor histidine kinase and response regulator CckA